MVAIRNGDEWLSVKDVARLLACTPRHVYSLIEQGVLKPENISPGKKRPSWRVPPEEIERFRKEKA
jgi:excisionase family DNA binding protein